MELYFGYPPLLKISVLLTRFHDGTVPVFGTCLSGKRSWFHFFLPLFLEFLSALLPFLLPLPPVPRSCLPAWRFIVHVLLGEEIEHFRFLLSFCGMPTVPGLVKVCFPLLVPRFLFIRIGGKQVGHGVIGLCGLFPVPPAVLSLLYFQQCLKLRFEDGEPF